MPRLRIVGAGRAGRSLAGALEAGAPGWSSLPVLGRRDALAGSAAGVELLVLAVPDTAIASVAAAIDPDPACVVAHLSGATRLEVLFRHPRRASIHPLVSLPNPEVGAARLLGGAWFAVAGDPLAVELVNALGGRPFSVDEQQRAAYHAAACIASNHFVALLGQVERVAAAAGVPIDVYFDLVRETLDNVEALGPAAALTGPVARGDEATLARHLEALAPGEREAYRAMADAARQLLSVRE
jgi:predicted short-subunit dehydrogenase-like oxidoreductase (DUF2520 family)